MPFALKEDPEAHKRSRSVTVAGVERVIYPLTMRQTCDLADLGDPPSLNSGTDEKPRLNRAGIAFYLEAAVIVFRRAYPELTVDELWDLDVSPSELQAIYVTAVRLVPGGDADAGEPRAASLSGNATGAGSSPTSASS